MSCRWFHLSLPLRFWNYPKKKTNPSLMLPAPHPKDPLKPYVKRIVGLPGEVITIVDGDAYANGELLRKSLPEVREARVTVFDMNYVPVPGGWGPRWLVYPPEVDRRLPKELTR